MGSATTAAPKPTVTAAAVNTSSAANITEKVVEELPMASLALDDDDEVTTAAPSSNVSAGPAQAKSNGSQMVDTVMSAAAAVLSADVPAVAVLSAAAAKAIGQPNTSISSPTVLPAAASKSRSALLVRQQKFAIKPQPMALSAAVTTLYDDSPAYED